MARTSESSGSLAAFLWRNKVWWLAPALFVLVLTGLLMYFGRSSESAPFAYTLF